MSGSKVNVLWSRNHTDKFITFGTDLSLYKIEKLKEGTSPAPQAQEIGHDEYAVLQSVNSDVQYMKCVAWCPCPNPDHLVAVGQTSGKVVLTSFGKGGSTDNEGLIGKEFIPRHARQCNHLSWNQTHTNLLAVALEKHRADNSILVWDVFSKSPDLSATSEKRVSTMSEGGSITRPFAELGPSETTLSLDWFPQESRKLAAGMNNKYLRLYDLNEFSKPQSIAYTKAVYGVCIDPHSSFRIASYVESQVSVWDTRNFDKPILTFQENRPVLKLEWCPTRRGLLGSLIKESSVVKLYDIQHASIESDDIEPAVLERIIQPHSQCAVSSFAWHPSDENRMLTISPAGNVRDITIFERISLSWSPDLHLNWACGRRLLHLNSVMVGREAAQDISLRMRRRAQRGYGVHSFDNLWQNSQLAGEDFQLRNLWMWLDYSKRLLEEQKLKSTPSHGKGGTRLVGVQTLWKGDPASFIKSDLEFLQWQGVDGLRFRGPKKTFRNEERRKILQLCGWGFDRDAQMLNVFMDRLENEGEYARAAAIALFNLKIRRAIQSLKKGATEKREKGSGNLDLNVVAMALSGFTDEKNTLLREISSTSCELLRDSYLRAMFAFLTADNGYEEILEDSGVHVTDRVAFAAMYLSDQKFSDYIDKMTKHMIELGSLDGIVLTGLGKEGVELLQQYLDNTGDVQTASAVAVLGLSSADIGHDIRCQNWIESYRSLLDCWKLWHQRAEFDIHRSRHDPTMRTQQQVFVSCNFCGKSIANNMLAERTRLFMRGGTPPHRLKITSCPGCRKPLPRCSLCLVNMGTAAGTAKHKKLQDKVPEKLTNFSDWFTWCQTCRHGGHAGHMEEWFRDHSECPVTACTCRCMALDIVSKTAVENTSAALMVT